MCYVCKKDITGRNYEHFGAGTSACPLQDQMAEDRHQQEADEAENAAIAAAKARDADVNEEDLRVEAHLNQRPGGQRVFTGYHELGRPPAGPQRLGVQFPPFGFRPAMQLNGVQDVLQEAQIHQERAKRMLEEHQHVHRLQPFLPAPVAPQIPDLPGPHPGGVPPIRPAHQYLQPPNPMPAVGGPPAQLPWSPFNAGAGEGLADRVQGLIQRDMLQMLRRDLLQNNHIHALPRNGILFPPQHPPAPTRNDHRPAL
jgi:hypothetical protein